MMSIHDRAGGRKYLTDDERRRFLAAADAAPRDVRAFCHTLAWTGCRISEALALTGERVDVGTGTITFESLKKRQRGLYRAVPIPPELTTMLDLVFGLRGLRGPASRAPLWEFSRSTAWRRVKEVLATAGIEGAQASPKGLRHAMGVAAVGRGIPLNLVQRWLGHAQLTTTAIYAEAVGEEERAIAARSGSADADPAVAPLVLPGRLAAAEPGNPLRAGARAVRDVPASACPAGRLPARRALARRRRGTLAGWLRAAVPPALSGRPCRAAYDTSDPGGGASRPRPDQQPRRQPALPLPALPHAARPAAPPGAALDHLPATLGTGGSVLWAIPAGLKPAAGCLTCLHHTLEREPRSLHHPSPATDSSSGRGYQRGQGQLPSGLPATKHRRDDAPVPNLCHRFSPDAG